MNQRGLTLIELMISMTLGILIILGAMQIFGHTLSGDRTATALARVQESGRTGLEVIASDARRAGYSGCQLPDQPLSVPGSKLRFPEHALSATADSVTFRYAQTRQQLGASGSLRPKLGEACDGSALYLYQVTYSNGSCSLDPNRHCIKLNRKIGSSPGQGDQDLLTDARLLTIEFAVQNRWISAGSITPRDLADADQLRLRIQAENPLQKISRTFSTTVALRNRQ